MTGNRELEVITGARRRARLEAGPMWRAVSEKVAVSPNAIVSTASYTLR